MVSNYKWETDQFPYGFEICHLNDSTFGSYVDPKNCGHSGYPSPISLNLWPNKYIKPRLDDVRCCNDQQTIVDCMNNAVINDAPLWNNKADCDPTKSGNPDLQKGHLIKANTRFCTQSMDPNKPNFANDGITYSEGLTSSMGMQFYDTDPRDVLMPIKEYSIENGTITYSNDGDTCFEGWLLFDTNDSDSAKKTKILSKTDIATLLSNYNKPKPDPKPSPIPAIPISPPKPQPSPKPDDDSKKYDDAISNLNGQISSIMKSFIILNDYITSKDYIPATKLVATIQDKLIDIQKSKQAIPLKDLSLDELEIMKGMDDSLKTISDGLSVARKQIPSGIPVNSNGTQQLFLPFVIILIVLILSFIILKKIIKS